MAEGGKSPKTTAKPISKIASGPLPVVLRTRREQFEDLRLKVYWLGPQDMHALLPEFLVDILADILGHGVGNG